MSEITVTAKELEEMLDRAALKGARQALKEMGLDDEDAGKEIRDIRQLLRSWNEIRGTMWRTAAQMFTTGLLLFIAGAVWLSIRDKLGK